MFIFLCSQVTYVIYTLWGKTFFCRFILMTGINQWERMRTEVKTVWVERGTGPRLLQPKPHLGMPRSRMSFGKVRTWDVRSLFFLVALIMLLVLCSSRQNKTSYSPSSSLNSNKKKILLKTTSQLNSFPTALSSADFFFFVFLQMVCVPGLLIP